MLVARRARTSVTNLLVNYRFAHVEALRVARHLRGREAGKEAKRIDPGLMRVMMDDDRPLLTRFSLIANTSSIVDRRDFATRIPLYVLRTRSYLYEMRKEEPIMVLLHNQEMTCSA